MAVLPDEMPCRVVLTFVSGWACWNVNVCESHHWKKRQ